MILLLVLFLLNRVHSGSPRFEAPPTRMQKAVKRYYRKRNRRPAKDWSFGGHTWPRTNQNVKRQKSILPLSGVDTYVCSVIGPNALDTACYSISSLVSTKRLDQGAIRRRKKRVQWLTPLLKRISLNDEPDSTCCTLYSDTSDT